MHMNIDPGAADRAISSISDMRGRRRAPAHSSRKIPDIADSAPTAFPEPPSGIELTKKGEAYAEAAQRAGELLKQIEPAKPGPKPEIGMGDHTQFGRQEAGERAGMSPHQAKQAIRVANVPASEFERQVESSNPPTDFSSRRVEHLAAELSAALDHFRSGCWQAVIQPASASDYPVSLTQRSCIFLAVDGRDRDSLVRTIERLMGVLDDLDGDPEMEPTLGAIEQHPAPYSGSSPVYGKQVRTPDGDQTDWSNGGDVDERERVCEDEGACIQSQPHDDDGRSSSDTEPNLGWPEQIDQEARLLRQPGWFDEDGEPELGWTHHGRGLAAGEDLHDDREGDDEREHDPAEWGIADAGGYMEQAPGFIGHAV